MESSIKDKYIILGFVGFAIVLISSIATLVIADSFNQDNFVRWIVFVCCNLLGWLLYLSFQTLIFDTYEIYKIKFGKKETIAEAIEVQEELSQNTLEEATSVPGPTSVPEPVPESSPTKEETLNPNTTDRAYYRPGSSRKEPCQLRKQRATGKGRAHPHGHGVLPLLPASHCRPRNREPHLYWGGQMDES